MALAAEPDHAITVVDLGLELDDEARQITSTLATLVPDEWDESAVARIATQPTGMGRSSLPEKRSYGSLFPFADGGQLSGLLAEGEANQAAVSGAYGGFSTVWGAQVMPFTEGVLRRWPFAPSVMARHYKSVLRQIPFAGHEDDLADVFPLHVAPKPLPALSARSLLTLGNYERNKQKLAELGLTMGRARLAMDAPPCTRCGLCMTGCPYGLVYSAAHTFDELRRRGRVTYRSGLLVHRIEERADEVVVHATERDGVSSVTFNADRVFVACGGVGTTRLVLNSLGTAGAEVSLQESRQFAVPFLSRRPTPDPRGLRDFTLNQFNAAVSFDDDGVDVSVIHFYSYNPALLAALPGPLRQRWGAWLAGPALSRLTVALGYLPGWHSPAIRLRMTDPRSSSLGPLTLSEESPPDGELFTQIVRRLRRAAPLLDLWPVTRAAFVSGPAKSYHFGGTFPHARRGHGGRFSTDRLGRLHDWRRVHLVDGSVLPDIPATTFTLTVMANAHRIAAEVVRNGR